MRLSVRSTVLLLLLFTGVSAWSQIKTVNPGLPTKEIIKYTETIGSATYPLETTLTLVGKGSAARYEYRTKAFDFDSTYWLDPVTLQSVASEITTFAPDAIIKKTTEYQKLVAKVGPGELLITDLGCIPILLRGYPWSKVVTHRFIYAGNTMFAGPGIDFEFQMLGRETITAGGRTWDCWHASTGLGAPYSWVLTRAEWWFAVEGTHPLIKTTAPMGGPGTPTRTQVLVSYQKIE